MMLKFLLVGLGGAFGSLLRFYVNQLFPFDNLSFPKATFIVNVSASLILGLTTGLLLYKFPENQGLKYFMLVGFCGAFSTFSTFAFELYKLNLNTNLIFGLIYVLSSVIFSVLAIFIGISIIKNFT